MVDLFSYCIWSCIGGVKGMRPHTCIDRVTGLKYNRMPVDAGIAQLAERKLPKLEVAGSTPVARSIFLIR